MLTLDNVFDKVLERYENGEITAFGKYFVTTMKREQRRLQYAQQAKQQRAAAIDAPEFKPYNWLEDDE
jgi:hypothetical protein